MKLLRAIWAEIFGLFVDDGNLAIATVVLIAAVALAVKLLGIPALAGGIVLALGCFAILAYSVARGARR